MKASVWFVDNKLEVDGSLDIMLPVIFTGIDSSKRRAKLLADFKRTHESLNAQTHTLYKDGDANIPDAILDGNGQVVLGLCKACNRGEVELLESACEVKKDEPESEDVRPEGV